MILLPLFFILEQVLTSLPQSECALTHFSRVRPGLVSTFCPPWRCRPAVRTGARRQVIEFVSSAQPWRGRRPSRTENFFGEDEKMAEGRPAGHARTTLKAALRGVRPRGCLPTDSKTDPEFKW